MVTNNNCDEGTAASGKILQGQGIGSASDYSTATYPSVATTSGTILRADGTNWVPSTATYPDTAGTSGNVLTSNGTNWTSSATSGGTLVNGFISTTSGSPSASTTTYLAQTNTFGAATPATDKTTQFYAPVAFTINKVYGNIRVGGTLASAQNCTVFIRVNNTTNTNITTTLQLTSVENNFNNSSLGLSLNAGDYFTFGFTSGAWTTSPTLTGCAIGWSS